MATGRRAADDEDAPKAPRDLVVGRASVKPILDGKQTSIRIPIDRSRSRYQARRLGFRDHGQSRQLVAPLVPRKGDRWAVRSSAEASAACAIVVASAAVVPLSTLTEGEARTAGYRDLDDLRVDWVERHDQDWLQLERQRRAVRAVEVELAAPTAGEQAIRASVWPRVDECRWPPRPLPRRVLLQRFVDHWHDQDAHLVTFEVDRRQRVRLLSKRPAITGSYTSSPTMGLVTEPEAIDADGMRLVEAQARRSGDHLAVLKSSERDRIKLDARLRRAQQQADLKGIDTAREEERVRRAIGALERKVRAA